MSSEGQKVRAEHLRRDAYLYVRQSTLRQVLENTESTERQYALRDRAVALGWPRERVIVIDSDLGQSGADADRTGFQRLVAEVGMGRVGLVLGLEVSRLARNCSDWHRLLELCALADTLILDEDGLYDPQQFNDRLLLGLKGAMSEAELHLLRARLRGGILNKARRGELRLPLPIGFARDTQGRTVLDPDRQVQGAVRRLFEVFGQTGSALAVVKRFRREGWLFPRRARGGANRGELLWGPLGHTCVLNILHNPRYAGAYVFGQSRTYRTGHGTTAARVLPQDQWSVLLLDTTPAYIGWEQYQTNRRLLRQNARSTRGQSGPPGRGCAWLQGLAVCGACGRRMTVRYHHRFGREVPEYTCQREGIERGMPFCQSLPGRDLDATVAALVLARLTPASVELAVAVEEELRSRQREADELRRQQVERARYEADLARRRYVQVDPENRLVAGTLEAEWNEKLRAVREAEDRYDRHRGRGDAALDARTREELRTLAADVARLWNDAATLDQDRKRIARLLIEDVTLTRSGEGLTAQVRFKGGTSESVRVGAPKPAWELVRTDPEVIRLIDELLNGHTAGEVAELLNARGLRSGSGQAFTRKRVQMLCWMYSLRLRPERLRAAGYRTAEEIAAELGVSVGTVQAWRRHGLLRAVAGTDRGDWWFEPLGPDRPRKQQGQMLSERGVPAPIGSSAGGAV
jgi:DNA invertase Pin-like site-specific DNA recombinase